MDGPSRPPDRGAERLALANGDRLPSSEERTASRFHQLKSGRALTGVYLKSTDNRPDENCWWCYPENDSGTHQMRDHLFKYCYRWKDRQAVLWTRVKVATKRAKRKWRVGG